MVQTTPKSALGHWTAVLWRFSRPHTILATCLQVVVGLAFAVQAIPEPSLVTLMAQVGLMLFAGLGLNIYVVGINQITDVAIDRINKPDLPLAAGDLSRKQAIWICAVGAAVALLFGLVFGPFWATGIFSILLLGSLYSFEPFRFKRFAVWSGLTIAVCRGVIFNVTTFLTWHDLYDVRVQDWTAISALCIFMFAFVLAIGIFKDLPDTEGDRSHRMLTYAVRFGTRKSFWAGVLLLCVAYISIISANFFGFGMQPSRAFWLTMLGCLAILVGCAGTIGQLTQTSLTRFYRLIWVLFYVGLGSFSAYALTAVATAGL